jgi:hypothetical protein
MVDLRDKGHLLGSKCRQALLDSFLHVQRPAAGMVVEMKHAQSWRAERLYRGSNPDISRTADAQKMCFLRACRSGAMELRRSFRLIIF